jgi:hypothetical protein
MENEKESLKEKSRDHFNCIIEQNEERIEYAEQFLCIKSRLHPSKRKK